MADLLTNNILTLMPSINECRLTLETGVAVSTTDQLAKTSVFLTPYRGNRLALYNGTSWGLYALTADASLALGTLTSGKNYDIFAYDSSGTVTLELSSAWTNDTTRADALALQDNVLCKSGTLTRRYLGTMRTVSTTATADSGGLTGTTNVGGTRFLWNHSNRVVRSMQVIDTTSSWDYTTATWRQARAQTGNRVEYVVGDAAVYVRASLDVSVSLASNPSSVAVAVGVDSTTTPSQLYAQGWNGGADGQIAVCTGNYKGYPGLGYHALNWLEIGSGGGTCAFCGSNPPTQTGLQAELEG